jgi:hypothetical protein
MHRADVWDTTIMRTIDRIFIAVFARYRRKPSYSVHSAWHAADYQVASYLALMVTIAVMSIFFIVWPDHRAVTLGQRRLSVAVAIAAAMSFTYVLRRNFRKYLTDPPPFVAAASDAEARVILLFRLFAIGIVIAGFTVFSISGSRL